MKHEPIFHVYRDGDRFFATLSESIINRQDAMVVWLNDIERFLQDAHERLRIGRASHIRWRRSLEHNSNWTPRTVETVDRWGRKTVREKEA